MTLLSVVSKKQFFIIIMIFIIARISYALFHYCICNNVRFTYCNKGYLTELNLTECTGTVCVYYWCN